MNPLYAVIVGCFIVLIVFLIVAIIAVWKRSRRRKPPVVKAHKRDSDNSNNFQTGDSALTKIDQNSVEDIGNPDVVPNKSGKRLFGFFSKLPFLFFVNINIHKFILIKYRHPRPSPNFKLKLKQIG